MRSFDKSSPFPEEINRKLTGQLSDFHFAPTILSKANLLREGVNEKDIYVVGNSVIDALKIVINKETDNNFFKYDSIFNKNSNNVLITCHRRENIGKPLENICDAIIELSKIYKKYNFIFPVHPNPLVRKTVNKKLINHNNIIICEPFNYQDLIIFNFKVKNYFI